MTAGIMLATNPSKWNQTSWDECHQRDMYKCFSHMGVSATSIWNYRTRATVSGNISMWVFLSVTLFSVMVHRGFYAVTGEFFMITASLQSHVFHIAVISIQVQPLWLIFRSTKGIVKHLENVLSNSHRKYVYKLIILGRGYGMLV